VKLPSQVVRVLRSPALAHLITINPDGTPQVSVVWMDVEDDELVCLAERSRQKVKNLRRDPRVVVSLEDPEKNVDGLPHHLVLRGHARIVDGVDVALQDQLARAYLGVEPYPFANRGAASQVVLRITVDRISGFGPHVETGSGGWEDPA
jgi:PPOX class probable F420-dependent enzyme